MTNQVSVEHLHRQTSRFDFDAAKRLIELVRGSADTALEFRALPESSEALGRFEDLNPTSAQRSGATIPARWHSAPRCFNA